MTPHLTVTGLHITDLHTVAVPADAQGRSFTHETWLTATHSHIVTVFWHFILDVLFCTIKPPIRSSDVSPLWLICLCKHNGQSSISEADGCSRRTRLWTAFPVVQMVKCVCGYKHVLADHLPVCGHGGYRETKQDCDSGQEIYSHTAECSSDVLWVVNSGAASQQEAPWSESQLDMSGVCIFSFYLCGLSPGPLTIIKTCMFISTRDSKLCLLDGIYCTL